VEGKGTEKLSLCLSKHHAMKTYLSLNSPPHREDVWSGSEASRILNLCTW